MVIRLQRGADLHMAQLMTLPLTVSCFSKIQIGFTFLVPAHPGSPRQRAIKRVCVCVCVYQSPGSSSSSSWPHGIVVTASRVRRMNAVTPCQIQLVLGWLTICGQTYYFGM